MKLLYKNLFLIVTFIITYLFMGTILKLNKPNDNLYYKEEINSLKETINYLNNELKNYHNTEYSFKTTKLLLKNEYNYNTGVIALGHKDSLKKGMYVVNNHNLVGIITDTRDNMSYVSLLSKKEEIPVIINNSLGILCDYDNKKDLYLVCNINNYENIRVGDIGVTVRDEYNPISYNVGKVVEIKDTGYEKQIYLKSNSKIHDIYYVSIFVW